MTNNNTSNWFARGGKSYAQYRPEYPDTLLDFLLSTVPEHRHAVDVGCGTGQLTQLLTRGFDNVTGIDPSETQIKNAKPHRRIDYRVAPAEQLPHNLKAINLIAVAQAAHWFNLPTFYDEAARIAAPDATIALISYGVLEPDETIRARFMHFYNDEIGHYWPPERRLVDQGYASIWFPFAEINAPKMAINLQWDFDSLMGYLSTWSAVKRADEAGHAQLFKHFYNDVREVWGDPSCTRAFSWPINMRAGKV